MKAEGWKRGGGKGEGERRVSGEGKEKERKMERKDMENCEQKETK